MAAILHDVLEDTEVTKADLSQYFGDNVADLVDGVSKLENLPFQSKADQQAENFRKMLLAISRDVRVILIKLADRLHNMRTLGPFEDRKNSALPAKRWKSTRRLPGAWGYPACAMSLRI